MRKVSDNKWYDIQHHEIGRETSIHGYQTVTCQIRTPQKPSENLQRAMKDPKMNSIPAPIPESQLRETSCFSLSEAESSELEKSWNEVFDAIAKGDEL